MSALEADTSAEQEAQAARLRCFCVFSCMCVFTSFSLFFSNHLFCFRERELAAVTVSAEFIKIVMDELDMDKVAADRALRENGGDLVNTLKALVIQS